MSEESEDDWWNTIPGPVRWLVVGALFSGVGSGAININKDTSDRFKGADFRREISIRDARISRLEEKLARHLEHSARYTQKIDYLERQYEHKHK